MSAYKDFTNVNSVDMCNNQYNFKADADIYSEIALGDKYLLLVNKIISTVRKFLRVAPMRF